MNTKRTLRMPIRIVFYKEAGRWIAHCLEFDLMGDGQDKQQALERLSQAISIQAEVSVEHENPANLFNPADGRFFEMFAAGRDAMLGEIELLATDNVVIENAACREYDESELQPT